MKSRRFTTIFFALTILLLIVATLGLRHEERRPNQHINQYWAVRSLSIWTFFGAEVYSQNKLAVYDMKGRTTKSLPEPISELEKQTRRFGKTVEGSSQFNLGEADYDRDGCIDYIYWALASSADPVHRMEATSVFQRALDRYPLTSGLEGALISDSDESVRKRMKSILARTH
ncbi:MAG: hypothetical protein Q7Q71_09075 [Verrucomicrobiota bacterium JB023]|nr:hypothetical protein [Verrucomicrobiota bacterium JB023]